MGEGLELGQHLFWLLSASSWCPQMIRWDEYHAYGWTSVQT